MSDKDLIEIQKSSKKVYDGKLISVSEDVCILPNKKEATREVVRHPGAVAVLAVKDNNILLVEQFRYPVSKATWEIPAGKLDPEEKPEKCAARELQEETGMLAHKMTYLFSYYTTPGFSDELMHLYFAEDLYEGIQQPDEDEFLNIRYMPFAEAIQQIGNEKLCDAKTIMAILWYKKHIMEHPQA